MEHVSNNFFFIILKLFSDGLPIVISLKIDGRIYSPQKIIPQYFIFLKFQVLTGFTLGKIVSINPLYDIRLKKGHRSILEDLRSWPYILAVVTHKKWQCRME